MAENTRTVAEDQRPEGKKSIAKTARIYAARLVEQGLTIDDLGSETVPLRRADDDQRIIADAVRAVLAKTGKSTVTEHPDEVVEELSDIERACLESMRQDFDRGIVRIKNTTKNDFRSQASKQAYQAALEQDKTAGQSWGAVQGRFLANGAALLKKCVELSELTGNQEGKGACLVGVYNNGKLAIRQRSSEIVNARYNDIGKLQLLFHPDAIQGSGQWAKPVEILRAVEAAGYYVPADSETDYYNRKKGLVAAFEAVTGEDYVASLNRKEWRVAMLKCPKDQPDGTSMFAVRFTPDGGYAYVHFVKSSFRDASCGAVLWLRG